jgi:hypothetical protein
MKNKKIQVIKFYSDVDGEIMVVKKTVILQAPCRTNSSKILLTPMEYE